MVISFSVINYVVSESVRLRQADTLFFMPARRLARKKRVSKTFHSLGRGLLNTGGAAPSYTPAAFSPSLILPGGKIPGTAGALQSASSLRSSNLTVPSTRELVFVLFTDAHTWYVPDIGLVVWFACTYLRQKAIFSSFDQGMYTRRPLESCFPVHIRYVHRRNMAK